MKHTKDKLTVLVDGDVLLYRAAFRSIKEGSDPGYAFNDIFNNLKYDIGDANYELHISGKGNFRKKIHQQLVDDKVDYKGKRKEKPEAYYRTRQYVYDNYKPITVDGYEADDTAAIRATELYKQNKFFMYATIDKDWQQFPGIFYNTQYKSMKVLSTEDRILFLHTQFLMGDAVDNVKGIEGIGTKKAAKLLQNKTPMQQFDTIIKTYREHHPDDYYRRLEVMGVMLYLVRDKDDPIWNPDWWIKQLQKYATKKPCHI